jgi:hypothetical protein
MVFIKGRRYIHVIDSGNIEFSIRKSILSPSHEWLDLIAFAYYIYAAKKEFVFILHLSLPTALMVLLN